MTDSVLGILKGCLLVLLYLFLLRVVMVVASELKGTPNPAGPDLRDAPRPKRSKASQTASTSGSKWSVAIIAPPELVTGSMSVPSEIMIGRGGGCAISIPTDTFASTVHARIFEQGNDLWLEDLGSTNGTRVNDVNVTEPQQLRRNDRVQIGSTVIEVSR